MAKIQKVSKSRKETRCGGCGKIIPVGSSYLYAEPAYRPKIVRCTTCGLQPYETSSSEYVQTTGRICDKWRDDYGCDDSTIDNITSDLESLKDDLECNLDNIPEQLRDGDAGSTLQEHIDSIESVISELENIDIDSVKDDAASNVELIMSEDDYKKLMENNADESIDVDDDGMVSVQLVDIIGYLSWDEVYDSDYINDQAKQDMDEAFEEAMGDAIDEALSYLE